MTSKPPDTNEEPSASSEEVCPSTRLVVVQLHDSSIVEDFAQHTGATLLRAAPGQLATLPENAGDASPEGEVWWRPEVGEATAAFAVAALGEAEAAALAHEQLIGEVIPFGTQARWLILPHDQQTFLEALGDRGLVEVDVVREIPETANTKSWIAPGPFNLVAAFLTPEELLMLLENTRWLRAELDSASMHVLEQNKAD